MWLNNKQISDSAISAYRQSLLNSCPNHVVIDNLFNEAKLDDVIKVLQKPHNWKTQKHSYSALYVDNAEWQKTSSDQRFVQRDSWCREAARSNSAHDFLSFLRGDQLMSVLSRIFNVKITDMNVFEPEINTNFFRLGASDFIEQHADDSPGREVCMLLYLNKEWKKNAGGELVFTGNNDEPISITPLYNRCVLFDPSSKGSEHWVKKLNAKYSDQYRYNVTSWYWSE
jgi:SM-20-related protein